MKQNLLRIGALLFLTFALVSLSAQEAVLASGADLYGGGGSVSYSVGQVAHNVYFGVPGSLAEGVHQPYEISIDRTDVGDDISLSVSAFPNPTTDHLILKADNIDLSGMTFKLIDLNGRIVKQEKITSNETTINMSDLAPASYLLQVIQSDVAVIVFKIIKN